MDCGLVKAAAEFQTDDRSSVSGIECKRVVYKANISEEDAVAVLIKSPPGQV